MNPQPLQYPEVQPIKQSTIALVIGGSVAVVAGAFLIWAFLRKK